MHPAASARSSHWLCLLAWSAAWLTLALVALIAIDEGVDDAYIVYRYVERFLAGDGLTFNDGERVEGYTSALWTLTIAGAAWLSGLDPPMASVVVNVIVVVLTGGALRSLLRRLEVGRRLELAGLALYAISYLYFRVVFSGLGLGAFTLLLVVFAALLISALERGDAAARSRHLAATSAIGGLLFAARPEGLAVLPATWLWLALGSQRRRLAPMQLVWFAVPGLVVAGAVAGWRQLYYGEWLPNSVIAKSFAVSAPDSAQRLREQIGDGVRYLLAAYGQQPAWAFALLLLIVVVWRYRWPRYLAPLALPILAAHAITVQNGGDWMPYYRLVTAYTPLLLAAGLLEIARLSAVQPAAARLALAIFAIAHAAPQLAAARVDEVPVRRLAEAVAADRSTWPYSVGDTAAMSSFVYTYARIGRALAPVWKDGDVLVAEAIGRIGYAAPELFIDDPLGLTDAELARDPEAFRSIWGRMNWRHSLSPAPAMVAIHYWPHQHDWHRFGIGYPEDFVFFDIAPRPGRADEVPVYLMVRRDRIERYRAAVQSVDAVELNYLALDRLAASRGP